MIPQSLDRLEACHHALIGALDARDIDALERTIGEFRSAVDEVRATGGWRENPAVVDKVREIASLSEAAHIRVNFLTDSVRQRIEALAAARGRMVGGAYGRDGRQG
jgi:hypothetical protein